MTVPTPEPDRLERRMGVYTDALEAGQMEDAEAAIMRFLALKAQTPTNPPQNRCCWKRRSAARRLPTAPAPRRHIGGCS
jgi:hypothetical protein